MCKSWLCQSTWRHSLNSLCFCFFSYILKTLRLPISEGLLKGLNKTWYLIKHLSEGLLPIKGSEFGIKTAAAAKSLQSCPTLCDPIDGSPPGSSVPGILQARILGWVAISFSNAWKWKVKVKSLSCVWLLATPWTAAYQAPPQYLYFKWDHCKVKFY